MLSSSLNKNSLRQTLRSRRQQLTPAQQQHAAEQLATIGLTLDEITQAQHIAVYLANDGEIDPTLLIHQLWSARKSVYLPVLSPKGERLMRFREFTPHTVLLTNLYGIAEPNSDALEIGGEQLDTVLLPLVGFDKQGGRLGMGGGFYDATFAFLKQSSTQRPRLIGLAHQCQEVETLIMDAWDIPLTGVLTDSGFIAANVRQ